MAGKRARKVRAQVCVRRIAGAFVARQPPSCPAAEGRALRRCERSDADTNVYLSGPSMLPTIQLRTAASTGGRGSNELCEPSSRKTGLKLIGILTRSVFEQRPRDRSRVPRRKPALEAAIAKAESALGVRQDGSWTRVHAGSAIIQGSRPQGRPGSKCPSGPASSQGKPIASSRATPALPDFSIRCLLEQRAAARCRDRDRKNEARRLPRLADRLPWR